MNIAIAGRGYVRLSNGNLLAQHNEIVDFDIIPCAKYINIKLFLKRKST